MNYRNYDTDDFIADEDFIDWVKNPDKEKTAYWSSVLKQHPEKQEKIIDARNFITSLLLETDALPAEEKLQLLDSIRKSEQEEEMPEKSSVWLKTLPLAAVLLLLYAASQFWFSPQQTEVITQIGESKSITLPDGSLVQLNSRSKLSYNDTWESTSSREVWLAGEAYFDVKKSTSQQGQKFSVYAKGIAVEVLGTKFNVNAHTDLVEVVLEEGKVELTGKDSQGQTQALSSQYDARILLPGDKASISLAEENQSARVSHACAIEKVNTRIYTSWKNGRFYFDATPLSTLKKVIEDNYGMEVIIEDPTLLEKRLSGSLEHNNLDVLCQAIESLFGLTIEKSDNKLTIKE